MTDHPKRWENDIVYHIFVDRFRNGDPTRNVQDGAFKLHDRPVQASSDKRKLTRADSHQHTFYNGDLRGIRDALPYLQDLGATTLLLTPIFESRSTHRYDTDDYLKIDPHLGSESDFHSLLADMHERGMKLVLDGVFGHTSFEHAWYRDPQARAEHYLLKPDGTPETWLDWGVLPKLDTENQETQERLLDVVDAWRGVDGWRLDASQHLSSSFLVRFNERLKRHNPEAKVIGEDWELVSSQLRDRLYDGVLNFPFRKALIDFLGGEIPAETMTRRLSHYLEGYPPENLPHCWNLLGNHDTERFYGAHARTPERLKLALALQFLLPGTPQIYYGEELGMKARDHRESRAPMLWTGGDAAVRKLYQDVIMLRRRHGVFAGGSFRWVHASNRQKTIAFIREDPEEQALVVINAGNHPQSLHLEGHAVEIPANEIAVSFR